VIVFTPIIHTSHNYILNCAHPNYFQEQLVDQIDSHFGAGLRNELKEQKINKIPKLKRSQNLIFGTWPE
jgi:hypothetical protein